jgi:hypothetical protein
MGTQKFGRNIRGKRDERERERKRERKRERLRERE